MVVNRAAFDIAVSSLLRQKKTLFATLVSLLPLAAAALALLEDAQTAAIGSWSPAFSDMAAHMLVSATIPLMALLLAGGLIADEAEDRTLSYLLVRPVSRHILYLSRASAVLLVASVLAVVQVLGLWVMRWVSYAKYAEPGMRIAVPGSSETVAASTLLWTMLPVVVGVALFASTLYTLLFGFVSVMATRYHFFVNLGYFGIWEALIGHLPFGGQRLTATHHLVSVIDGADRTKSVLVTWLPTHPALSILALVVAVGLFLVLALVVVQRRDFHVTSATT